MAADAVHNMDKKENRPEDARAVLKWQQSMRRFMMGIIIVAFVLFAGSVFSIVAVWQHAQETQNFDINFAGRHATLLNPDGKSIPSFNPDDNLEYVQLATRTLLEKNLIERRYNQAKLTLITRTWISYIGFITGMLLALMGATFVLGKLSDSGTTATIDSVTVKGSLQSASPGVVLAVLGTVLMGITLFTDHRIDVADVSTYLPTSSVIRKPDAAGPPPALPEPDNPNISEKDKTSLKNLPPDDPSKTDSRESEKAAKP